jgi:hypothetical protein
MIFSGGLERRQWQFMFEAKGYPSMIGASWARSEKGKSAGDTGGEGTS